MRLSQNSDPRIFLCDMVMILWWSYCLFFPSCFVFCLACVRVSHAFPASSRICLGCHSFDSFAAVCRAFVLCMCSFCPNVFRTLCDSGEPCASPTFVESRLVCKGIQRSTCYEYSIPYVYLSWASFSQGGNASWSIVHYLSCMMIIHLGYPYCCIHDVIVMIHLVLRYFGSLHLVSSWHVLICHHDQFIALWQYAGHVQMLELFTRCGILLFMWIETHINSWCVFHICDMYSERGCMQVICMQFATQIGIHMYSSWSQYVKCRVSRRCIDCDHGDIAVPWCHGVRTFANADGWFRCGMVYFLLQEHLYANCDSNWQMYAFIVLFWVEQALYFSTVTILQGVCQIQWMTYSGVYLSWIQYSIRVLFMTIIQSG